MLGRATYEALMTLVATDTLRDNPEWEVLAHLLREALCLAVMAEAQRRHLITVADGRVTLAQKSADQADTAALTPTPAALAISRHHLQEFQLRGLSEVRDHLNDNPLVFVDYTAERLAAAIADANTPILISTTNHGGILSI